MRLKDRVQFFLCTPHALFAIEAFRHLCPPENSHPRAQPQPERAKT
jgi:hypothetical protein